MVCRQASCLCVSQVTQIKRSCQSKQTKTTFYLIENFPSRRRISTDNITEKVLKNDKELFPPETLKYLLSEVKKECSDHDIIVSEKLVTVLVKLMSLDPSHGLHLDNNFERRSVRSFANKCVERLSDKSSGCYLTLSMQIYFTEHNIEIDHISKDNRRILSENIATLTKEIISGECKTNHEQERLLKKIAVDILVNTSMGNPINGKLVQEALSALKSVLSKNEVAAFIASKESDRITSLEGLREVVCGILIFNRDSGFFVEDKVDVEKVIQSGFVTTKSQLNIAMNELQSRLNLLTTVLSNCFSVFENEIKFDNESNSMDPVNFSKLVKILILFRQHEIFLKNLTDSLVGTKSMIDHSVKMFRDKLHQIHELVKFRTAIPTEKIFPEFTVLSQYWQRLQDIILLLSEINVVNEELMKFSDSIHPWEDMAYLLLGDKSIETDTDRTVNYQHFDIDFYDKEVSVHKYFVDMKVENKRFCTYCLVAGKGLLIHSTLSIGVCRYKNKNYGFINQWAADQFRRHPEKYQFSIIEIARCNPELIIFLDKFDNLKDHRNELHYVGNGTAILYTKANDIDTQTETHPISGNIDKNYCWNIWYLRRNAIKLSNLIKCETISTQTNISYGNAEVNVQAFPRKIGHTQTRIDRGSDMAKQTSIHLRSIDFDGISDELENAHLIETIDEQE